MRKKHAALKKSLKSGSGTNLLIFLSSERLRQISFPQNDQKKQKSWLKQNIDQHPGKHLSKREATQLKIHGIHQDDSFDVADGCSD